jgi:hypothetical protein
LIKAKEWELVHEGVDPVNRRRYEKMKRRFSAQFGDLMQNTVEGDGANIVKAMNRFLALARERALTMKVSAEGKYEIAEKNQESIAAERAEG